MHREESEADESKGALIVKGKIVREDTNGFVCLDDIWELSGEAYTRQPRNWRQLPDTKRFEVALLRIVRNSNNAKEKSIKTVCYAIRGRYGATFGHPVIAAHYAGYLNHDIEIEIKQVWLRYRSGDPTLADEVLERASDEGNRWAAARATGRVVRRRHTDTLQRHGVSGKGYGRCTHALYSVLFNKSAKQLQAERGVAVTRDGLEVAEIAQVTLSESMSGERIEDEDCRGTAECAEAIAISASFIRKAVEQERASRRKHRLNV